MPTLQEMKQKVDDAKTNKAKYEGQLESISARLKDEYGLDSIADAEKKAEELEASITAKEKELAGGIEKLEADYDW